MSKFFPPKQTGPVTVVAIVAAMLGSSILTAAVAQQQEIDVARLADASPAVLLAVTMVLIAYALMSTAPEVVKSIVTLMSTLNDFNARLVEAQQQTANVLRQSMDTDREQTAILQQQAKLLEKLSEHGDQLQASIKENIDISRETNIQASTLEQLLTDTQTTLEEQAQRLEFIASAIGELKKEEEKQDEKQVTDRMVTKPVVTPGAGVVRAGPGSDTRPDAGNSAGRVGAATGSAADSGGDHGPGPE